MININELLLGGGGILLLTLSIVQIAPIKINPWSWLASLIGDAVNKNMIEKIDSVETKVSSMSSNINTLDQKLNNFSKELSSLDKLLSNIESKLVELEKEITENEDKDEERYIISCRVRILRFGDEILHEVQHSKDHFDQLLIDCTDYEHYCNAHPDFLNDITEQTITLIKETYSNCMKEHNFL